MILDSYSERSSNVCNQVKSAPSEETAVLLKRSSPSLPSSKLSFDSSVLNSPRSVEDAMMEKPSRSPSVSSDVDDSETASTKSNEISTSKPKSCKRIKTSQSDAERSIVNAEKAMKENESKLADNVKRLELIIQSLQDSTSAQSFQISQLQDMITQKDKVISDLTEKLEHQRDYSEIKRELAFVRSELSHFGPVSSGINSDSKLIESYLSEKTKTFQSESLKLDSLESNNSAAQQIMQRSNFFNQFSLPQLQGLGNVESFGTLLGEEIANTYAKFLAKREPSFISSSANNSSKSNANNNQNSGNTINDSLSPSQLSNGDELIEEKSTSTTPTSAMICPEAADPLSHSPLGATTVSDLGLKVSGYSSSQNTAYDKLQQQLRSNVEKYMNDALNTLQISRCVREFLSMHNIGQRLFAKYVLGLSQGTVSELLSKPKPWDKLTEKGRDSYRKMHAWATDERCINLLKSMVPRKGKDTSSYKQEDPVAEERIAQILSEAQRSMKAPSRTEMFSSPFLNGEQLHAKLERDLKANPALDNTSDIGSDRDEKSETLTIDHKSPNASFNSFCRNINESINFNEPRNRITKHKFNDNEEHNQSPDIMRFYQDQLTKLIGQQFEEGLRNSPNYEELRNAVALQQELSRINPFAAQATSPELLARLFSSGFLNGAGYMGGLPLSLDSLQSNPLESLRKNSQLESQPNREIRELNSSESRVKIDSLLSQLKSGSMSPSQNGTSNINSSNSPSSVLNNGDLTTPEDLAASPLQRMQSITNSLLSQSTLPSLPSQPPRPSKAVLPPITQQQFDQYNNLNTEDIVKRVKEQLSQYSISQRLFGESVLGLSQGSVSDLLARPKPWHMLTQKGREPFIRMKMFLEDENAIHKLVASQYKIAPEKLMRTGSFVAGSSISNISMTSSATAQVHTPPSTLPLNATNSSSKSSVSHLKTNNEALKYEQSMSPSSTDNGVRSNASTPDLSAQNPPPVQSPLSMRSRMSGYSNINNNILRQSPYMQPSVYELAALTSDLDTQTITTRIKETLMAHNIGQKIFGEVVLGLSQGSVSELLSKPKPWHMLSIKGREPFIRMQLWLNDQNNIEKLQTLKNERREANKRRRNNMDDGLASYKSLDNPLFNFSNSFNMASSIGKGLLNSSSAFSLSNVNSQPTVKKARILFTEEQKEALRIAFAMDPYPSSSTAEFLAKELALSIRTITNWFHNHRMRLKQINTSTNSNGDESNQTSIPYNIGRDNISFDQNHFRTLLSKRLDELKSNNPNFSTNSNGSSNNNQFGSFNRNMSGSPQHRFKYSSMYQTQSVYSNNTNSCSSPGSNSPFHEEEEMRTLDLSMSSHNQQMRHRSSDKLDSTGRSSVQDDSDDGCRSGVDEHEEEEEDHVQSDEEPRKNLSNKKLGSSRRKPQHVMSSSSRRKAAQPQQWVAPIDPALFVEDDYVEDYEDDRNSEDGDNPVSDSIMNGAFAQQMKLAKNADLDDQKTDEEMEDTNDDKDGADNDEEDNSCLSPYQKLKSSTSVMSKMAMNEDSSSMMQECV